MHDRELLQARQREQQPHKMPAPTNRILNGLPKAERALLEELYEPIDLISGQRIHKAGDTIEYAVFPHAGVISLVGDADEDTILELSLLGDEGMFGLPLALGTNVSDLGAIVQADGFATRMEARAFSAALDSVPVLRGRMQRYTRDLIAQVSRTAICNTFHSIEQRAARWILTMADRTHVNEIRMTQAFLAGMLGVRRPAVSQAASTMQQNGVIDYSRGTLEILDRRALERSACSCYRVTERFYR
jgi:CRP-like cAMP-binding protein